MTGEMNLEEAIWSYIYEELKKRRFIVADLDSEGFWDRCADEHEQFGKSGAELQSLFERRMRRGLHWSDLEKEKMFYLYKKLQIKMTEDLVQLLERRFSVKLQLTPLQTLDRFANRTTPLPETQLAYLEEAENDSFDYQPPMATTSRQIETTPIPPTGRVTGMASSPTSPQPRSTKRTIIKAQNADNEASSHFARRKGFSEEEDLAMWHYVLSEMKKKVVQPRGLALWKSYVQSGKSKRAPINLASHFRKQMLPKLIHCRLTAEEKLKLYQELDVLITKKERSQIEDTLGVFLHVQFGVITSYEVVDEGKFDARIEELAAEEPQRKKQRCDDISLEREPQQEEQEVSADKNAKNEQQCAVETTSKREPQQEDHEISTDKNSENQQQCSIETTLALEPQQEEKPIAAFNQTQNPEVSFSSIFRRGSIACLSSKAQEARIQRCLFKSELKFVTKNGVDPAIEDTAGFDLEEPTQAVSLDNAFSSDVGSRGDGQSAEPSSPVLRRSLRKKIDEVRAQTSLRKSSRLMRRPKRITEDAVIRLGLSPRKKIKPLFQREEQVIEVKAGSPEKILVLEIQKKEGRRSLEKVAGTDDQLKEQIKREKAVIISDEGFIADNVREFIEKKVGGPDVAKSQNLL